MPKQSGAVFLQRIRDSGNYGTEPHLLVCNALADSLAQILHEYDVPYVLVKNVTKQTITEKFNHLVFTENELTHVEARYREAHTAFITNMIDMAEELACEILREDAENDKVAVLLGDIRQKQGSPSAAAELYRKALLINPKSLGAAHKHATALKAQGNFREAARVLDQLAMLNPYHLKILENAGLSCFEADMIDRAKVHVQQLESVDATNKVASQVNAEILIKEGPIEKVVEALRKGHTEEELVRFLNNAGAKLSMGNDVAGALKMYLVAVKELGERSKFSFAIYYNVGIAHKRLGNIEAAKQALSTSLKLKPDFDKAKQVLASLE
jgi:tetratricopeptide (TPR) repeat protein